MMDEETLREMRARWEKFESRYRPPWNDPSIDEEKKFAYFCELELLGPKRVMAMLQQGHFSESLPPGNC
jgi:hypothetical protein